MASARASDDTRSGETLADGTQGTSLRHRRAVRPPRMSLSNVLWGRKAAKQNIAAAGSPANETDGGADSHGRQQRGIARSRSSLSAFLSPRGERKGEQLDSLITQQFPDPDAIRAFAEALEEDQGTKELPHPQSGTGASAWKKLGLPFLKSPSISQEQDGGDGSPRDPDARPTLSVPISTSTTGKQKVGKIAAVSDFAPIRERTTRDTGRREGFVYALLRWPLLLFIFLTIGLEFFAYVVTRQIVNVVEWAVAHRGRKGVLRRKMRKVRNFEEWTETALELDEFMSHEKWKRQDASGMYDWILIKKVLHSLQTFREQGDDVELMAVLDLCCRNNFAGTENFRLYSETYYGTKYLIEGYLEEVERGIEHIVQSNKVSVEQKRAFLRGVSKNLGRSALCLSGGGAFGYYHIGLVRALLDAKLLPKIVSGTSAGGLIAALTCTRTDEELSRLLVPEVADRITACEEPLRVWAKRAWQTGARFDPVQWAEKAAFFTMGSLTFREAYERTGKTLNISVIPSERNSPVKLLNYLTAPRCVIWSALLASAAVPGLLPPVCLMQKTRKGEFVPWNWGHRFKDGSLRVDIPLQDLHSMFAVNYPIVSQVNPHVHLFFFAPTGNPGRPVAHRKGKGWRGGFILSASEHVLKLHLSVNFKIIRDLDLLPAILGTDWSGVFLQRFGGAVTIWPKTRFWDWIRILSDPDRVELARMMRVGQQATWPKLHMIENRMRLERAVEAGRRYCRRQLRQQRQQEGQSQPSASTRRSDQDPSMQGGAHQDSGTEASAGFGGGHGRAGNRTPGTGISDTDGEMSAPGAAGGGDYFHQPHRNGSSSTATATAAARRRRMFGGGLSGMGMGMMTPGTDDGGGLNTPGADGEQSAAVTPGELPMPSRSRSQGMDDDAMRDAMAGIEAEGPGEAGDDPDATQQPSQGSQQQHLRVSRQSEGSSSTSGLLGFPGPDQLRDDDDSNNNPTPRKALTAEFLSPSMPSLGSGGNGASGGSGTGRQRRRSHQARLYGGNGTGGSSMFQSSPSERGGSSSGGWWTGPTGHEDDNAAHGSPGGQVRKLPSWSGSAPRLGNTAMFDDHNGGEADARGYVSYHREQQQQHHHRHHQSQQQQSQQMGGLSMHERDWSGGRGSMGPSSPWGQEDEYEEFHDDDDESDDDDGGATRLQRRNGAGLARRAATGSSATTTTATAPEAYNTQEDTSIEVDPEENEAASRRRRAVVQPGGPSETTTAGITTPTAEDSSSSSESEAGTTSAPAVRAAKH